MDTIEIIQLFKLLYFDNFIQCTFIFICIYLLIFILFVGFVPALILLTSLPAGFLVFQYLFKYRNEVDTIFKRCFIINKTNKDFTFKRNSISSIVCNVCGKETCDRGRTNLNSKPWSGVLVPEEIDSAMTDLLNKTLDEFLMSWFKELSSDIDFPQEIKASIRYATSVLVTRLLKVDLATLLANKVMPAVVHHVEWFQNTAQGKQIPIHPAMYNRDSELAYLRCLTTQIMQYIIPPNDLHCKNFTILAREILAGWILLPLSDTISDPLIMNSLLILILERYPLTKYSQSNEHNKVEFLSKFVSKPKSADGIVSALHPEMSTILKDQKLLYAFMQFLKSQGAVHILHFCLDVEEFNRRMLIPELSTEELDLLHRDAWDLYSLYFSSNSPDSIDFPPSLVTQMRKVLSKDVTKLRTSPPLFQAYEYAYGQLDTIYCPKFHYSDDFYVWLCGPRIPCCISTSESRMERRRQESTKSVSKFSSRLHKIKGALKSSPVLEGQAFDSDNNFDLEADTDFAEALEFESETERDLSAWRVSIPSLTSHIDPSSNKIALYFNIVVKRIDITQGESSEWTVERRLTDFYSLDAKLTEFHGEFTDAQLPPRRLLISSVNTSLRPESTQVYEEYLQKLLSKPALRGSDLLFAFLACPGDFVEEDNIIGRFLRKSVPISLRKERGQNLDPFIVTFIASTESKVKNSKIEWKDMNEEMPPRYTRSIQSVIFGNNFNVDKTENHSSSFYSATFVDSPTKCFLYCGMHIFGWNIIIMKLVGAVFSLIGNMIDAFIRVWLDRKLQYIFVPKRIAHLIRLLQWAIFESKPNKDRIQVTKKLQDMLQEPGGLMKTFTLQLYQAVFVYLQCPTLNKQLFYCLLDALLEELFPELQNIEENNVH